MLFRSVSQSRYCIESVSVDVDADKCYSMSEDGKMRMGIDIRFNATVFNQDDEDDDE